MTEENKIIDTGDIVYFELNNWFAGRDYPNAEPFLSWLRNDFKIKFFDKDWLKENKLCVAFSHIDMSSNFCITAKKEWVEQNCPELLTKYREFLRFPEVYEDGDIEDTVYGQFDTPFLEYTEENIGFHHGSSCYDDDDYYEDDEDDEDDETEDSE